MYVTAAFVRQALIRNLPLAFDDHASNVFMRVAAGALLYDPLERPTAQQIVEAIRESKNPTAASSHGGLDPRH